MSTVEVGILPESAVTVELGSQLVGGVAGTLPVASGSVLGGVKVGSGLKINASGVLSVDTATVVSQDNTKPVTSGAVYTEIGNIAVLLAAL